MIEYIGTVPVNSSGDVSVLETACMHDTNNEVASCWSLSHMVSMCVCGFEIAVSREINRLIKLVHTTCGFRYVKTASPLSHLT